MMKKTVRRWTKYLILMLFSFGLFLGPSWGQMPSLERAQQLYEAGQFSQAAQVLEQIKTSGQIREQIIASRNLALVYQQLGEWKKANQTIAATLDLLTPLDDGMLLASVLDVQGSLQLEQGQAEAAINSWERSNQLYEELGESEKAIASQINQAQALQRLGFYRRSVDILTPIVQSQADSLSKAVSLRSLGDGLLFLGDLEQAQQRLEESLAIAQRLGNRDVIAQTQLSFGNVLQEQGKFEEALERYQQANLLQGQLNQLSLSIDLGKTQEAQTLWPKIQADLTSLPSNYARIFARINLAENLIRLKVSQEAAQNLAIAIQQSRDLGDQRLESSAIGALGYLYEQSQQWGDAQKLTEQALLLAQTNNAQDLAYRWQWQIGRILAHQNAYEQAIAAYGEALKTLKALRTDLVAVKAQIQLSFQKSIEPMHREYISLLLEPKRGDISAEDLEQTLQVVESLQLAELDNFFKEACLQAKPTRIDRLDQQAAVIYPIILDDRLEMIIRLPNQPLRHYTSKVQREELEKVTSELRQFLLIKGAKLYLPNLQQLYRWLIQPIEADLATNQVKNLVFVLDGTLRNLPMSALYDGQQFLVQKYGVAITPGLQLLNPQPLQKRNLSVFIAGLSESRQGFSPLPYVAAEVEQIQANLPSQVLLNQEFTEKAFKEALRFESVPVVHIATHGQFSSQNKNTFILTWDDRLDITTFNSVLQVSDLDQTTPIELLVLSACETAIGDQQAALGMAGMAVRAGARSTIATLWQVDDEATAILMKRLYEILATRQTTKAEALRLAQLEILQDPRFGGHPYFWAPYILVGNWL